jgi:hypothetical protein
MSDDLKRKIEILRNDFEIFAQKNLKIKIKDGDIQPLIFNEPQKYIHQQIEKQLKETGKVRAIILKSRQQGSSTYTEGRFYWRTSMNRGKQAYIITHEISASDNLFRMSKRFHDLSHPALKPSVSASNSKAMIFDKLDSGFQIGTAGARGAGRSGTIQYLHSSEVAWWPNAEEHFAGIVQCVPDANGSEIIVESTANGASGRFYELWQDAVNGKNEYECSND